MAKALQDAIEAFTEQMDGADRPPCFTKAEYEVWLRYETDAPTLPIRRFVCRDCSIPHQREMVKRNKCFLRQWDDEIEGFVLIPVSKIVDG
jgi:hypothetical protein